MAKVYKIVLFVAFILDNLSRKLLWAVEYVMNNVSNFLVIALKEELKLIPVQKDYLFTDNLAYKLNAFLVLIKLFNQINFLIYFLFQESQNFLFLFIVENIPI